MATTWINRGHFYVPHVTPVLVDCNFVVDPTNSNGLGMSSLKGQGVKNVFMHTSATPGKGPNGLLNPNPASGIIMVQLADNFNRYYGGFNSIASPVTGSDLAVNGSALTAGVAYIITVLGSSTAADWVALGVPPGVPAAVGLSFVALVTGTGSGSGQVKAAGASGIDSIEVVGDPNLALGPVPVGGSPYVGGWLTLQCLGNTASAPALTMNSYTPAGVITNGTPDTFAGTPATLTGTVAAPAISFGVSAPAAKSVINLAFYLSQSSVKVAGE